MKQIQTAKYGYIICALLMCSAGVSFVAFPGVSTGLMCVLIGIVLALYGFVKIIGYFSKDLYSLAFQFDLALGIFALILSALVLLNPARTIKFVQIIVGISVVADSLFKLQTAIDAKKFGLKKWWLILFLSVISNIMGLLLIFYPFCATKLIMSFIGVTLFANGIENLCVALCTVKIFKNKKTTNKEEDNDD